MGARMFVRQFHGPIQIDFIDSSLVYIIGENIIMKNGIECVGVDVYFRLLYVCDSDLSMPKTHTSHDWRGECVRARVPQFTRNPWHVSGIRVVFVE